MESMVPDDVARRIFATYEAAGLITACSWCRRVELDESWQRAPRAALTAIDELALTHGVCPSCRAELGTGAV